MNLETLTKPISLDSPCGEDLYYEQSYSSILDADIEYITGESSNGMFDSDKEQSESGGDWGSISRRAIEYLSLTKHLGLVYYFTAGLINTQGLSGLKDGLVLYRLLLVAFWDDIHPLPEDGDLTDRIDEIEMLKDAIICDSLLNITLAEGRLGKVSFKDVIDSKTSRPDLVDKVTDAINLTLQREPAHFDQIAQQITDIENEFQTFTEGVWPKYFQDQKVNLDSLRIAIDTLKKGLQLIDIGVMAQGDHTTTGLESEIGAEAVPALNGEIQGREDVKKAIDKIIRFYSKNEPTSPCLLYTSDAADE